MNFQQIEIVEILFQSKYVYSTVRIALIQRDWMGVPKSASDLWFLLSPIKSIQRIHRFRSTHLHWLCKELDMR